MVRGPELARPCRASVPFLTNVMLQLRAGPHAGCWLCLRVSVTARAAGPARAQWCVGPPLRTLRRKQVDTQKTSRLTQTDCSRLADAPTVLSTQVLTDDSQIQTPDFRRTESAPNVARLDVWVS